MSNPMIQAALFSLTGGGDRDIFLAPASALAWCEEIQPGSHTVPDTLKAELAPFLDERESVKEALQGEVDITPGSADNDAALHLSCLCRRFDTTRKALAYAEQQGWQVVEEEYHGCIY